MQVIDLGILHSFRLLVFVTADSLGMVQRANCHMFPFWFESLLGNDNQLLFSIPEVLWMASKKRTSEKSL